MTQTVSTHTLRPSSGGRMWGVAMLAISIGTAIAQLPSARLDTVFPCGGRQGKNIEVTVSGADLDETGQLLFSDPGITAQKSGAPSSLRFVVSVGTNVPVGNYEVRTVGRFGLSNPRTFVVGELPEGIDSGTNFTSAAAQLLAVNSVIHGRVQPAKSDYYRFEAKQGQRILIECDASAVDSRLEPTLWLYNSAGKELDRSRRAGFIDFIVPAEGVYTLRVHDFLNRGGDDYFYRLTLSTRPHLDYALPFVVPTGTNRTVTLFGRNLPGAAAVAAKPSDPHPLQRLEVKWNPAEPDALRPATGLRLPIASGGIDFISYRLHGKSGLSNPLLWSPAAAPVVTESEPNDLSKAPQKLIVPCEVAGLFQGPRDNDWFQFEGHKGEVWIVEVRSQRLGFIADPALAVYRVSRNDKGEEKLGDLAEAYDSEPNFGGVDFKTGSGDPSARIEVKEDGVYRILVNDQATGSLERGARAYQLSIRKPAPDFRLVAVPVAPPSPNKDSKELKVWSSWLRKGATVPVRVMVFRRDGMDQEITLRAEGLPGGVSCSGGKLAGDARSTLLFFHADETVSNWAGAIRIVGQVSGKEGSPVIIARGGTLQWGLPNYENEAPSARLTDDLLLGVSAREEAPLSLELGNGKPVEATVGTKITLPVTLQRRAEFPDNTKLRLVGHPVLGGGKELELDKKATNGVFELDLAALKFPEGRHELRVETLTKVQGFRSTEGYHAAEALKSAQEKLIPQLKASLEKAKSAEAESVKREQQAEQDAKAMPEKEPALKQAREAKAAAAQEVVKLQRQLETAQQQLPLAEEGLKAYARKDFTDTFYSMPLVVNIQPAKPAAPAKP